jgi:hypothetical protein
LFIIQQLIKFFTIQASLGAASQQRAIRNGTAAGAVLGARPASPERFFRFRSPSRRTSLQSAGRPYVGHRAQAH